MNQNSFCPDIPPGGGYDSRNDPPPPPEPLSQRLAELGSEIAAESWNGLKRFALFILLMALAAFAVYLICVDFRGVIFIVAIGYLVSHCCCKCRD